MIKSSAVVGRPSKQKPRIILRRQDSASAAQLVSRMLDGKKRNIAILYVLSFGALQTTMGYLKQDEQTQLQQLCLWTYHYGVSRAQNSVRVAEKGVLLWDRDCTSHVQTILLHIDQFGNPRNYRQPMRSIVGNAGWSSVQISPTTVFQVKAMAHRSRTITIDHITGKYVAIEKSPMKMKTGEPILASDQSKTVFALSSGSDRKVCSYDIATNKWNEAEPTLHRTRTKASACFMGSRVYVVGGVNTADIEWLDTKHPMGDQKRNWILIRVSHQVMSPMWQSGVAPLNDRELAIMGGITDEGAFSGVFVMNIETEKLVKVADGTFRFTVEGNQAARASNNQIIAFGQRFGQGRTQLFPIIKWHRDDLHPTKVVEYGVAATF